jgi:DNA-binding MarR family transcriptional regulator
MPQKYNAFQTKMKILNQLYEKGCRIKVTELVSDLDLGKTSINNALKDLQSMGWVVSEKAGRAKVYSLTALGRVVRDLLEEGQITVILDDEICKYLAGKLLAPEIEADKWESPSAIFTRVENKYEINDKGHLFADLYLELIQLQPKQGISTPIICDHQHEPTITWNKRELSPKEFARCEVGSAELFSSKDIKSCFFYAYSLHHPYNKPSYSTRRMELPYP